MDGTPYGCMVYFVHSLSDIVHNMCQVPRLALRSPEPGLRLV